MDAFGGAPTSPAMLNVFIDSASKEYLHLDLTFNGFDPLLAVVENEERFGTDEELDIPFPPTEPSREGDEYPDEVWKQDELFELESSSSSEILLRLNPEESDNDDTTSRRRPRVPLCSSNVLILELLRTFELSLSVE